MTLAHERGAGDPTFYMSEATIEIQVNGERRTALADLTVAGLLGELNIRPDQVAVELNLEILDRAAFERRSLRAGDRLEIISFIGGGNTVDVR
jgi:thiamine biosynthesis protein ThiS